MLLVKGRLEWPEAAAAALLTLSLLALWNMPLHHDAMWQLWIGRQMYHGAGLYRDIFEVNPPLWFWISGPLAGFAEIARLRPGSVLILFFVASAGLSLALVRALLAEWTRVERSILYAAQLIVLLLIALPNFAQREHFALIAAVPYVALIARRADGGAVPPLLAVAVGLYAAVGLGLKHYFLLVPLALEAWHIAAARSRWKPLRPETLALGAAMVAYFVSILLLAPDYLSSIVPVVRASYEGFDRPFAAMLSKPALLLWPLAGLGFALRGRAPSAPAQAALTASLAFLVAYFIQGKGWSYQFLPAVGMLLLAAGAELAVTARAQPVPKRRAAPMIALLAVLAIPAGAAIATGPYSNRLRPQTEQELAGLQESDGVMVFSTHASSGWPMVEERKLKWSSRYLAFWMLPAVASAERSGSWTPALRRLASDTRLNVARDLACAEPARILIDAHRGSDLVGDLHFDMLAFFRAEPTFEAIFRQYRLVRRSPDFDIYRRIADRGGAKPEGCRTIY